MKKNFLSTKTMALIAVMSALAAGLMFLDFPLAFIAPPNMYKMDLGDLPALIGTFAIGPLGGIIIEIFKVLLKLIIKPTSTAFIGELSNLLCGLSIVIPAGIIYKRNRTLNGAINALIIGSLIFVVVGTAQNYFFTIPAFCKLYGMPLEAVISAGTAIIPIVKDLFTFCLVCVAPFNLIKIIITSVLTFLLYKRVSKIFR